MERKAVTKKKSITPKIKIYTTPKCIYCKQAKAYFTSKKLKYTELDVSKNDKALKEMIKISGHMAVPQIMINGKIIIGFDKEEINKSLEI